MELRLVYRILRKVSDWALVAFYSEVYIDSQEKSFPKDAPLIITPCHHNELIDVATLSATIPYRRKVSFWAKSTTFAHPVLGPILSSSGAIPVRRNPDKADAASSNAALFDASTRALARNQVIGVFPEGTSYTEPAIAQILSGAAWAALEFMRSQHGQGRSVMIVPVGIVYTNKSKFRSRVHVEYGLPIDLSSYVSSSFFDSSDPDAERAVVKAVMADVEAQLLKITINAPDWETMYAAQMARNILWVDERNVKLKDWVVVGQTLVKIFSPALPEDEELGTLKRALTKYLSLLGYTNISHAQLAYLLPDIHTVSTRSYVLRFFFTVLCTVLNPSFLLFIPPCIAHIPAYLFATLGSKYLAPPGEEESQAQFKVILGGLGAALGAGASSYSMTRLASRVVDLGGMRSKFFLWSLSVWVLIKWHNTLVDSNYERIKQLLAAYKILLASLQPRSWDLPPEKLGLYTTPPVPAANPFLRKHAGSSVLGPRAWLKAQPPAVPARRMIFHLLVARREAISALAIYRQKKGWDLEKRLLSDFGAAFPASVL